MSFLSGRTSLTTVQTGDIADNSVTLAKLAHGTASQNIAYDGSGVPVDVALSSGATDAEKANIMLNAFRIAINGGLSVQNMVDGVVDEFEDETGVDTGTSTNETYDATGDYYNNAVTYTADLIPTMTSNTAPSGTASSNVTYSGYEPWRVFDKTTSRWRAWSGSIVMPAWLAYEFSTNKTIAKYTIKLGNTGGYSPDEWTFEGWNGASWEVLHTATSTGWTDNEKRTFYPTTTGSYIKYKINMTAAGPSNYPEIDEIEMMESVAPPNMALISNATTALATPTDAFIVLWQEDVDAITLNTDLKAYASRDGSTYSQITLTKEATFQGTTYDSQVAQATGTLIGDMTGGAGAGLAEAFNGDTSQGYNDGARSVGDSTTHYVGKDWGSGVTKTLTGVKIYPSNDEGFGGASHTVTLDVYGSASAPSNTTDGTVIANVVTSIADTTTMQSKLSGFTTTTAYRYHWITITLAGSNSGLCSEVEFYEAITPAATNIHTGSVDISGQSSGTSMKYKIETLNTKEQKIHAVALQWS